MPSKHYRLKLEHPYAKAGTIVEEYERKPSLGRVEVLVTPNVQIINIPLDVEHDWLEEVKEEAMCSVEFAKAMKQFLFDDVVVFGRISSGEAAKINNYLDSHTSKDN